MAGKLKERLRRNPHRFFTTLTLFDLVIYALVGILMLGIADDGTGLAGWDKLIHFFAGMACVILVRGLSNIYGQIWRYGGIQGYIRLILSDAAATVIYYLLNVFVLYRITFARLMAVCCMDLLGALAIRMFYRYCYKCGDRDSHWGAFLRFLLRVFTLNKVRAAVGEDKQKIRIAIVGAGRVGVALAGELIGNPNSAYVPRLFVETDDAKIGGDIQGVPVYSEKESLGGILSHYEIQEIVIAVPQLEAERKKALYDQYSALGYSVKVYDFPVIQTEGSRRSLRDFDVEELLFRKPLNVLDGEVGSYYKDKVIMITGGGGSIGSELCRQLAKLEPRQLVLLDVYENGAYDVQQELRIRYGGMLDVQIAIVSVCNLSGLERVFSCYRPQIVFHAAAHKHVPLMEKDCTEAVENNVFGTLNTVKTAVKFGVERFVLVSSDKAVNPTNVMGATKRLCEMIVQSYSVADTATTFGTVRFGNVLGSAGSVIPLFRRQIANGGPITITDKRIIRYFMTIPEASQLVLESGAMAKNGELFVLDMGKPVKILELAENMIRLAGFKPYEDINIIETGLRPGEKLYEELLIKSEELDRTDNALIFIERDQPLVLSELEEKLSILRAAVERNDDEAARQAVHDTVPTFHTPEEVNSAAEEAEEMRSIGVPVMA